MDTMTSCCSAMAGKAVRFDEDDVRAMGRTRPAVCAA